MQDRGDGVIDDILEDHTNEEIVAAGMPVWGQIIYRAAYALQFISFSSFPLTLLTISGPDLSILTAPLFFVIFLGYSLIHQNIIVFFLSLSVLGLIHLALAFVNNNYNSYYFDRGLEILSEKHRKAVKGGGSS
jgi:hypothetical protein